MGLPVTEAMLKPSGIVLAVVTAVVAIFDKWVWKWNLLHPWLVSTPNLNGTYSGTIGPLSTDSAAEEATRKIDCYLSIHQTLSGITVRLYTEESDSVSIASDLRSSDDNRWDLRYLYENYPAQRVRSHSPIHCGGVTLAVDDKSSRRLTGCYWTDRGTKGEMLFQRVSRDPSKSYKEATEKLT